MQSVINQASVSEKSKRLAPWVRQIKNKVTTSPEITLEEKRIKILKVVERPFIITSKAELLEKYVVQEVPKLDAETKTEEDAPDEKGRLSSIRRSSQKFYSNQRKADRRPFNSSF